MLNRVTEVKNYTKCITEIRGNSILVRFIILRVPFVAGRSYKMQGQFPEIELNFETTMSFKASEPVNVD